MCSVFYSTTIILISTQIFCQNYAKNSIKKNLTSTFEINKLKEI